MIGNHHHEALLAVGAAISWTLTVASFTSVLPIEQGISVLLSIILTSLLIYGWFENRRKKK